jgi:hypothetical protein
MASVVLFQTGNKSRDPRTGNYYDPWSNHIWFCLEQIRIWNPKIDIYMITNDDEVTSAEKFDILNIKREFIKDLPTRFDIDNLSYFDDSINPSERACGLRPFYIESVMEKYKLSDVFSFDNDVLIYEDLENVSGKINPLYNRTALTPDSKESMVLGMCYIKDFTSYKDVTEILWRYITTNKGKNSLDMSLWNFVYLEMGLDYVGILPTWVDGLFSENNDTIGGIFDPSSIGQYLLGCDNGNPPGSLFPHHYIHNRISEGKFEFLQFVDSMGRKSLGVKNKETEKLVKILSIHVHNKKLKLLM